MPPTRHKFDFSCTLTRHLEEGGHIDTAGRSVLAAAILLNLCFNNKSQADAPSAA